MELLTPSYWDQRYKENLTGWDVGYASTPISAYIDQLENKDLRILIPGCGNAYEAEYLMEKGFENVFVVDWSGEALKRFHERVPEFPAGQVMQINFFDLSGKYDLIIEQTFFCSLNPALRRQYAEKMWQLLNPKGQLVGVLFNDVLNHDKPPFGGNQQEYKAYFQDLFELKVFEMCHNSIKPRKNCELFINYLKKNPT